MVDHVRSESARLTETFQANTTMKRLLGFVDVPANIHHFCGIEERLP